MRRQDAPLKRSDWTAFRKDKWAVCSRGMLVLQRPKEIHNLLSYFGHFEFLLILLLLILQLLHFVLENPQLSDQALKQNAFRL